MNTLLRTISLTAATLCLPALAAAAPDAPVAREVGEGQDAPPAPSDEGSGGDRAEGDASGEAQTAPQPKRTVGCVAGTVLDTRRADATTAVRLVCDELRQRGLAVGNDGIYRVSLSPLGEIVVLSVRREAPDGTLLDSRTLHLNRLEEVTTAAPRIADAIAHDKPLEQTARVDNLVGTDTRKYDKKHGETLFGVGVLGYGLGGSQIQVGYGVAVRFSYETVDYAVGIDARLGGGETAGRDSVLGGVAVGGRYFLSTSDVAPFLGAGLGLLVLSTETDEEYADDGWRGSYGRDYDGSGLAPYIEVGVEFLRFHSSRLDLSLRADAPLFELEDYNSDGTYVVPLSLMASYSW